MVLTSHFLGKATPSRIAGMAFVVSISVSVCILVGQWFFGSKEADAKGLAMESIRAWALYHQCGDLWLDSVTSRRLADGRYLVEGLLCEHPDQVGSRSSRYRWICGADGSVERGSKASEWELADMEVTAGDASGLD